jgi:hypothetical protein
MMGNSTKANSMVKVPSNSKVKSTLVFGPTELKLKLPNLAKESIVCS